MPQKEIGQGRLRVRKACEICKRRKVKCDGSQPCGNCVKHRQECKYIGGMVKRRHRSDNEIFASRCSSAVNEAESGKGTEVWQSSPVNVYDKKLMKTSNSIGYASKRSPWQSFSLDKYRFHRRYQNLLPFYLGASLMSEIPEAAIKRYKLKQPRIQDYGWNMSGGHYLKHDSNWKDDNKLKPVGFFDFGDAIQLSVVCKLLGFFFQEINPPISIVHESVFWRQFNDKFLPCTKIKDPSAKLFQSMLYLILAITIRFREGFMESTEGANEKLFSLEELRFFDKKHREESLFEYAYGVVTELTFEWESFELIQSWLLITFYFRTCYRQTACWNALGQAINMCNGMSLYLNRFPRTHSKYDESRAWHCFWACFIMDKLVSFQMGRFYQLPMPVHHMTTPGNWCNNNNIGADKNVNENDGIWSDVTTIDDDDDEDHDHFNDSVGEQGKEKRACKSEDDWFHYETTQLFELAVIVQSCQRRDGEELDLEESLALRKELDNWFEKNVKLTRITKQWKYLYQIQPVLSYLDVRLTFETRRLFLLINQPLDTGEMIFPIDTPGLVKHCQLSVKILSSVNQRRLYFVPWWLNLSQLFTSSLATIALIHSGLQTFKCRNVLQQCMDIWNDLTVSNPKNPPGMMSECLWCIKMLNYMCCLRLQSSASHLENLVGTNPGDSSPNDSKFSQFGKISENRRTVNSDDESVHANGNKFQSRSLTNSRLQSVAAGNGANRRVLVSASSLNPSEDELKFALQHQAHLREEPNPNLNQPILAYNSGPLSGSEFPRDSLNTTRLHNIPSWSLTDNDTENKESNDATVEGLFSYLQWFDQNLM